MSIPILLELLPKESEVTQNILAFNEEEGGANLLQITLLNDSSQTAEIQDQSQEAEKQESKKQDPKEKKEQERKEKERIQTQRVKMLELQRKLEALDTVEYAMRDLDKEIKYQLGFVAILHQQKSSNYP